MKKLLIAVPFVATASWAGTTLYSGSQTRPAYEDLISQLDGMTAMHVSTESYSSGFASSRAITQVRATNEPDSKVLFRLQHDISHSPVTLDDGAARLGAARIVTTLVDDQSELSQAALSLFEGSDTPVVLESDVGFDGKVSNQLRSAPFTHTRTGPDGTLEIAFGATEYDIALDADGAMLGTGRFDGGRITEPELGIDIVFGPGTDTFEYQRLGKAVFVGEQRVELGTTTIKSQTSGLLATLDDVAVDLDASLNDEQVAVEAVLRAGDIDSPLPLNAVSMGVRLAGLNVTGLEQFAVADSEFKSMDTESATEEEMAEQLLRTYAALITPGVSVDYDLAMSNDGGDASATMGFVFKGDGSASGYDSMTTVGDLVRATHLSSRVEADAGMLTQTPAALFLAGDQLEPWLTFDGSQYRSKLSVTDLIVDVNGNPMALEMMAGDLLDMPLDLSMLLEISGR